MANSATPGFSGRHARLQSMMRVIAMSGNAGGLDSGGNSIAWNLARSGQDVLLGYGLCYGELDAGSTFTSGPTTQGPGHIPTKTQSSPITPDAGPGKPRRGGTPYR